MKNDISAQLLLIQSTHRMTMKYDSDISHIYVPNINARIPNENGGFFIKTNSSGFRSDFNYTLKKNSKPRLLIFGDSNTAGDGVSNEERFSEIIGEKLNSESYNYGLSATGTDQQLLLYQKFAKNVENDLVILFLTVHNIERIKAKYWQSFERTTGKFVWVPKPYYTLDDQGHLKLSHVPVPMERKENNNENGEEYIAPFTNGNKYLDQFNEFSNLRNIIKPITSRLNVGIKKKLSKIKNFQPHPDYDNSNSKGWKLMEALIKEFRYKVEPSKLLIVPLPTPNYLFDQIKPSFIDRFNAMKSEKNIKVFNITSKFMDMDKDEIVKLFFKKDSHYSAYGHHKIAEYVSDYIVEKKLI